MAEFCLKCFLKVWLPNAYERAHIVPSEHNELCESCMSHLPCVDHIDQSDLCNITTSEEFSRVAMQEMKSGHRIACAECGATFENDDLAFTHETGECPYCHTQVRSLWMKG